MRKIVLLTLMMLFITGSVGASQFVLTVVFQNDDIVNASITIEDGRADLSAARDTGSYTAALKSYNNTYLINKSFDTPEVVGLADPDWFAENGTQMTVPNQSRTAVPVAQEIHLPYRPTVKQIEIYHAEKKITTVAAARYATCNLNGVCDEEEFAAICPADCVKSSDSFPIHLIAGLGVIVAVVIYLSIEPG